MKLTENQQNIISSLTEEFSKLNKDLGKVKTKNVISQIEEALAFIEKDKKDIDDYNKLEMTKAKTALLEFFQKIQPILNRFGVKSTSDKESIFRGNGMGGASIYLKIQNYNPSLKMNSTDSLMIETEFKYENGANGVKKTFSGLGQTYGTHFNGAEHGVSFVSEWIIKNKKTIILATA